MTRLYWTPDQDATLATRWLRGDGITDIARELGRSRKALAARLHRLGLGAGLDLVGRRYPREVA